MEKQCRLLVCMKERLKSSLMASSERWSWRSTSAVASWKHMAEAPTAVKAWNVGVVDIVHRGEAVRYLVLRDVDRL